jgi:hypothetical protein
MGDKMTEQELDTLTENILETSTDETLLLLAAHLRNLREFIKQNGGWVSGSDADLALKTIP